MEKEKGHPQAAQNTPSDHNDNSTHTQRLHLLAAFEKQHSRLRLKPGAIWIF